MILSDLDLLAALTEGRLVIDPGGPDCVQPASVDLRLGNEFHTFRPQDGTGTRREFVDPFGPFDGHAGKWLKSPSSRLVIQEVYCMEPGEFLLAHTLETVGLADDLVARIEGRSTIGRWGLAVHITAGFVDPGFRGQLTLELYNFSPNVILLRAGMPIAQLAVQRLQTPAVKPYGHPDRRSKYQAQTGATPARPLNEAKR